MGCAASSYAADDVDLTAVDGEMTSGIPGYSFAGTALTETRTGFVIKDHACAFAALIGDEKKEIDDDQIAVRMESSGGKKKWKMVFKDPKGTNLAILKNVETAVATASLRLYSYTPNFVGQASTEKVR